VWHYGKPMDDARDDTKADSAYRWTIRSLYLLALVANVWLLLDSMKETPEGRVMLARLEQLKEKTLSPWKRRHAEQVEANRVILEAMMIVDGADNA